MLLVCPSVPALDLNTNKLWSPKLTSCATCRLDLRMKLEVKDRKCHGQLCDVLNYVDATHRELVQCKDHASRSQRHHLCLRLSLSFMSRKLNHVESFIETLIMRL